jgi:hypothetical protein
MKFIFLFFFSSLFYFGNAQTEDSNHTKYITYKNNLKYFRVVGEGAKRSIIGERRGGLLSFGDGGVNQGWYIAVLATEYAVLVKNGNKEEAQNVIKELYYALMSIDRLDAISQSRYEHKELPDYDQPLNAIAVRTDGWSDVPDQAYYDAINEENRIDYPVNYNGEHWVNITTMERQYYAPPHKHDYFSQDQLYHVLMGLYLTYFYVPGEHDISFGGAGIKKINLKEKAKEIALRFIHTVADNHFKLKTPSGKNAFGGNAIIYANPLIYIAKAMGSDYKFKKRNNPFWNLSGGIGASWPLNKTDLAHMHLVMASVSDARFSITRSNAKAIYRQAKDKTYNWEAFYPLLHNNLWGEQPMDEAYYQLVEDELTTAPMINPENSNKGGPKGWRAYPKYMKSKEHQDNGNPHFTSYYSGIDYMLLYNLYELRRTN